jgi:O-antigen/teichoic acid export membrane protein
MATSRRDLFRGFAVTLGSEGISLACSVVSFVILVLLIPAREYGEYSGILGVTSSVSALAWQAVPMVVLEITARDPDRWALTLGNAWWSLIMTYGLALACAAGLVRFLIPSARVWVALVVVTGDLALWCTHSAAASRQATKGLRSAAQIRSAVAIIRAVGLIAGALISTKLSTIVIASTTVSWMAAIVILFWIGGHRITKPSRTFLNSFVGYQVGGSASSIQEEIDKTFVLRNSGETLTAQYAGVFRIFQVLALPMRALAGTLQTRLVVEQRGAAAAIARLTKISQVTVLYGVAAWGVLALAAGPLTQGLPDRFGVDKTLFYLLGAILPVRGLIPNAANVLVGLGKRTQRAVANLIGCGVALGLYSTLIPRHGPRGAAVASLLAELTVLCSLWAVLIATDRRERRKPPKHLRPVKQQQTSLAKVRQR